MRLMMKATLVTLMLGLAAAMPARAAEGPVGSPLDARSRAARLADLDEAKKAQAALDELIRAYEVGNVALIRSRLDPAMIGYQRFLDGVVQDSNRLIQIRIHLKDTQVQAGPDVAVIQTRWEKRFLTATGFAPDLYTGQSQFLLHRGKEGWRVAAFGGDNLFASQSGVLAQLGISQTGDGLRFELLDPDLAGMGSATVTLTMATGSQNLQLNETTPGRFQAVRSNAQLGAPSTSLVTMKYLDSNPGGGRPPSVLTKSALTPYVAPPVDQGTLAVLRLTLLGSNLTLEVVEPDMAGRGSLAVTVVTAAASQGVTLLETVPGTFSAVRPAASLGATSGRVVTMRYLDTTPGNGAAPVELSRSLTMPYTGVAGQLSILATSDSIRFEVYDPDLAGQASLAVTVVAPIGTQTVILNATAPGRFFGIRTPGSLGVVPGSTVTLRYNDADPGGPPAVLSRTIVITS